MSFRQMIQKLNLKVLTGDIGTDYQLCMALIDMDKCSYRMAERIQRITTRKRKGCPATCGDKLDYILLDQELYIKYRDNAFADYIKRCEMTHEINDFYSYNAVLTPGDRKKQEKELNIYTRHASGVKAHHYYFLEELRNAVTDKKDWKQRKMASKYLCNMIVREAPLSFSLFKKYYCG